MVLPDHIAAACWPHAHLYENSTVYNTALTTCLVNWIQEGGNVNERNKQGTPLLLLVVTSGGGMSVPSWDPPIEAIRAVLAAGADPDARTGDIHGYYESPLIMALESYWRDVVLELLAHGADLDLQNSDGDTPLSIVLQSRGCKKKGSICYTSCSDAVRTSRWVLRLPVSHRL